MAKHGKSVPNGSRPGGHNLVHMTWSHLLFLHWPINPALLKKLVPPILEIDTFEGRAYVGLVAFNVSGLRPVGTPSVPGLSSFLQLNARTYVKHGGNSGVYFLSIDASNAIAVWMARSFFHLPYFRARIESGIGNDRIRFESVRTHQGARKARFSCEWVPGKPLPPSHPGELTHFLTERFRLYTTYRNRAYENQVWHERWPLKNASIAEFETNVFETEGMGSTQGEPIVHYCDELAVEAWPQRESGLDESLIPWLDPALSPPPAT